MSRFLFTQCQLSEIPYPRWARKWINVRKLYANYYQCRRHRIEEMLSQLGMKFEGKLHCGIDDTRNIARITMRMLQDGCSFKLNEFIHISNDDKAKRDADSTDRKVSPEPVGEVNGVVSKPGSADVTQSQSTSSSQDSEAGQVLTALSLSESEESVEDLIHYYKLQSLWNFHWAVCLF